MRAPLGQDAPLEPARHGTTGGGSRFQLRLLDGFHLDQGGRTVRVLHSARRLIAYLGIRGQAERSVIARTLWPAVPDRRAYASLRTVLWRLGRLSADPVVTGRGALALAGTVDADVPTFVAAAQRTVTWADAPICLPVIGELLPGWYDDWVLVERERLRQLQLQALAAVATRLTAAGRYAEAIETALTAVRLEPLREDATRVLIAAHLAENNVVEAVRCYEAFRANLAAELGVRPSVALEALVRSYLCPAAPN